MPEEWGRGRGSIGSHHTRWLRGRTGKTKNTAHFPQQYTTISYEAGDPVTRQRDKGEEQQEEGGRQARR